VLHDTANGGTVYTPGLAQREGSTDRFAFHDWLGSTRYLSDNSLRQYVVVCCVDAT
jgi:hypothetical protein